MFTREDALLKRTCQADPPLESSSGSYQAAASGVAVSAESAGQPLLRLLVQSATEPEHPNDDQRADQPVAEALGVNLYAKQLAATAATERQLKRLCR